MKRITVILTAMLVALVMGGSWSWAAEQECSTETTGWVLESPGKNWVQVDEKTVVDKEAVDPVPGHWDDTDITFYTWTGGPFEDAPPVYSDDTQSALNEGWNATNGNPQGKPHQEAGIRVPYNVSNNPNDEPGLGSWFLKSGTWVPEVPGTDAVTHQEYKFEKTTCVDKPDEPKPTPTPEPTNPDKPDEPKADKPEKPVEELAATGGNLTYAAIAAALLSAGSGMLWFGRRRLTD